MCPMCLCVKKSSRNMCLTPPQYIRLKIMKKQPVIVILDIGKTNKKLFVMDENYHIILEHTEQFADIMDDDGEPCEDIVRLSNWIELSLKTVINQPEFDVKAVNFSTYGASFVLLKTASIGASGRVVGEVVAPLYNYLKAFPDDLKTDFYARYGGEILVSSQTASPVLGNLNSGMQLYFLKERKPHIYANANAALHLPQYASFLVTKRLFSDITSIGCHTNLWHFEKNEYHEWVEKEGISKILPPIFPSDAAIPALFEGKELVVGVGLHDSSAALIPYLMCFHEPFILISTGTWCISMNPFNDVPLTPEELAQDSLCYLSYQGKPVKAARIFAGNEHEIETRRIAEHFNCPLDFYKNIEFDSEIVNILRGGKNYELGIMNYELNDPEFNLIDNELNGINSELKTNNNNELNAVLKVSGFEKRDLIHYKNETIAYHQLMLDLVKSQAISTNLIIQNTPVRRLFIDGGFSKNPLYMNLLAESFPNLEVFAASVAQATAVGAALAIHRFWNRKPLRKDLIDLKYYAIA
jgi:sugar (pentulose or hexulose) kinase